MNQQHNFVIVGADTDGIAFKKPDEKPFTVEERAALLTELNAQMDGLIHWEDDGVMKRQIVVKAKNYVMQDEKGNVKIKGSGLKATSKEKALQTFIREIIDLLLKDRKDQILFLYLKYAREIMSLKSIDQWCTKKTVTKAVLNGERTNETRVLDAIKGSNYREGDKVHMFFKTPEELCLRENFSGEYDANILLDKLHSTLEIFDTILDTDLFPNFSLKRNSGLLMELAPIVKLKATPETTDGKLIKPPSKVETPIFPAGFWQTR